MWCVFGVGVRRGFAWCVRSQVVGMATRRGARDETGARTHRARASGARATCAPDKFSRTQKLQHLLLKNSKCDVLGNSYVTVTRVNHAFCA